MILYSFQLENEEYCEFDKFINRFDIIPGNDGERNQKEDYEMIALAVDQIVKRGARSARFRPEGNVDALPGGQCNFTVILYQA